MKRRLFSYASLLLALLAGSAPATAQEFKPKAVIHINRIDTSKFPKVRFYFAELDSNGDMVERSSGKYYKLVLDMQSKKSFKTIKKFSDTGESLTLILVLQISASMSETLPETKKACKRLIKIFGSNIKVGLVAYTNVVTKKVELTSPTKLLKELDALQFEDIMTVKMEEGIKDALEMLEGDGLKNKTILVVSDGLTEDLKESVFTDLGKLAAGAGVVVHSIGFAPFEMVRLRTLYELSKSGNGSFRAVADPKKLTGAFLKLQREMTHQVVVSKELPAVFDGDEHDFTIRVAGGTLHDQMTVVVPEEKIGEGEDDKDGGPPSGDGQSAGPLDDDDGPSTLWIIGIAFGGVLVITIVILVFMKIWLSGGKPRPAPLPPGPAWHGEEEEEEEYDEEDYDDYEDDAEDDEDGYHGPGPIGHAGPIGMDQHGAQGPPMNTPQPAMGMAPMAPGGPAPVGGPMAPGPQDMSPPVAAPGWQPQHAVPAPISAPPMAAPPVSAPPVAMPTGPTPVGGGYQAPEPPPPADHSSSQLGFSQPVMSQPQPGDMSPRGTAPMELPSMAQDQGQSGVIPLPSPLDLGSLPTPQAGRAPQIESGGMPQLNLPPPSYKLSDFAAPGEGIQVSNQANLEILPAGGVMAPIAESSDSGAMGGGGWDARQTVVFSMSELEQSDLVAWIVPLDDPSFPTLRIHDEFVLGSDPQCTHVVQGVGVEPRHAILDLDPQGYWLRWAAHERATDSQLLQDGDRFRVGDRNFLFKLAIAFSELPKAPSRLEILDGTDKGRTVPLQENVTLAIGSHPSCAVVIRGEGMGHRHALAIRQGDTCHFEDLGTEGGLSFEGALVGTKALRPGQEIVLGRVRIIFVHEE